MHFVCKKISIITITIISALLICLFLCSCGEQVANSNNSKESNAPKTTAEIYQPVIDEMSMIKCIGIDSMLTSYPTENQKAYDEDLSYIPRINESPSKYAFIDLNNDGIEEMIVSGNNVFLSIYTYDPKTYEISYLKDMYDDDVKNGRIVTTPDTLREGGEIYHCYVHGNNTHYKVLEYTGTELKLLDEVNVNIGTIVDAQISGDSSNSKESYDAKISKLEETYPANKTVEWHDIINKRKAILYGTIKVQVIGDRINDTSYTNGMIEAVRKYPPQDKYGKAILENTVVVYDLDKIQKLVIGAGDDGHLLLGDVSSFCLGTKESDYPEQQKGFEEFSKLDGEKIYMLVDLDNVWGQSGIQYHGCENSIAYEGILKYSKNPDDLIADDVIICY